MYRKSIVLLLLIAALAAGCSPAKTAELPKSQAAAKDAPTVKDSMGVPGPLVLSGQEFRLAFVSSPKEGWVLQEYLPAGQKVDSFKDMLTVEAYRSALPLQEAVGQKIAWLNKRKQSDPVVNYRVIQSQSNPNDYILDFIISEGETVEWNACRYQYLNNDPKSGALVLYALGRRGYGKDIEPFMLALKEKRPIDIAALAKADFPKAKL